MVVSELFWLRDDPPSEVKTFFDAEGADITDRDTLRKDIALNGYQLVGDFVLPAVGWWENYYIHLAKSLERFTAKQVSDPEALVVAQRSLLFTLECGRLSGTSGSPLTNMTSERWLT